MIRRKLTNQEIISIPKFYRNGLSSWAIATNLGLEHKTILTYLKKLNIVRRSKSDAAKEGIKSGRIIINKNKIPSGLYLDENLSYILGVLAGDGFIDYDKTRRTYNLGLSATDKEFVEKFKISLFNFFKIKSTNEFKISKNKNWKDQFITRLCSKEACEYILSIGEFRKESWTVPISIKESTGQIKCAFIQGFFDSEGEIDKQIGRVGVTSMNFEGLKEVQNLLNSLGIRNTIIKVKDNRLNTNQKYKLRIHDKNSIKLFNELIGFTIQRKQQILDRFTNNIREAVLFPRDRDRLTP